MGECFSLLLFIQHPLTSSKPQSNVPSPTGLNSSVKLSTTKQSKSQLNALKSKKAWEIATSPAKQIPMNLIMTYMTGNNLQIFSITTTLMLFTGPAKAILSINDAFKNLDDKDIKNDVLLAKITFILLQFVVIAIGIYKLNSMGLIPNKEGDWLSFQDIKKYSSASHHFIYE